ncbi:hypothetical protein GOBAR_AA16201 [Gossypium barbadense]|uniref:DUF4283 domain-containing protein n=1 Tax=Gossypium barbadense TaxID=3634 RepID=A0A2P5XMA5_GOSBA|nr:hypothetical protein GOBAR_AA16201 [Gossypium barbadense]
MEDGLANLRIHDEEEEIWAMDEDVEQEFCLVGCLLTARMVNFQTMKNMLANVWHLIGGLLILNLREMRFLFKFFYEVDIDRVIKEAPWTFNNHLMVFHRLLEDEDSMEVPLTYSFLWVQIHDLLPGMISDMVTKQFGYFIRSFI